MVFGIIGIFVALGFLFFLVFKGWSTTIATVLATIVVCIFTWTNPVPALVDTYSSVVGSSAINFFLLFGLSGIYAEIINASGAGAAFARTLVKICGRNAAVYVCAVATLMVVYGGVNPFIVVFTMYPITLTVFREANLPRHLIPGVIYMGSAGFVLGCLPFIPSVINVVACGGMGVGLAAAPVIATVTSVLGAAMCFFYLRSLLKKARANGETFIPSPRDADVLAACDEKAEGLSGAKSWLLLIPMLAVVLATNLSPTFGATGSYAQANIGMALGIVVGILLYWKRLGSKLKVINEGFSRCSVILPVCAAVAFGTVVKSTAAFQGLCDWLLTLDMSPLVSLAIQCNVFTAAMGSGTGAIALMPEMFGQTYVDMGLNPEVVARVMAISSQAFDTLPHNSMVVTVLAACDVTHRQGYKPIFVTSVLFPFILVIVAVILGTMGLV